jgi:hypothetical protein
LLHTELQRSCVVATNDAEGERDVRANAHA